MHVGNLGNIVDIGKYTLFIQTIYHLTFFVFCFNIAFEVAFMNIAGAAFWEVKEIGTFISVMPILVVVLIKAEPERDCEIELFCSWHA